MANSVTKYIVLTVFSGVLAIGPALHAEEDKADRVGTDHLFAFSAGTDMDEPGSKELAASFDGRFSRSGGAYKTFVSELSLQYQATQDLQLELEAAGTFHHVKNVPGMDDRNTAAFSGLAIGLTYRLLDRATHSLGLAVSATPYWTRVDDDSGEPVSGVGSNFQIAGDMELIPKLVVGVANVSFEPETSKTKVSGSWSRQSTLGFSGGLMVKLSSNFFTGLEARYLRRYDALNFGAFAGEAIFVGPTTSITLSENKWLTFGWSAQMIGRANGEDGALDLTNFDRQQVRLAFGISF